jgi:hypothetical protein
MRFVGIDVASERHVVAMVDESGRVLLKTPFTEDADGYKKLLEVLRTPVDALVYVLAFPQGPGSFRPGLGRLIRRSGARAGGWPCPAG